MEEIADFVEGLGLQFVEVQDFPIGVLLKEDSLSCAMFVAHVDIIIESEFYGRGYFATLVYFADGDVFPLLLAPLVRQLHEDSVEVLVY